jgi:hypothetical protein
MTGGLMGIDLHRIDLKPARHLRPAITRAADLSDRRNPPFSHGGLTVAMVSSTMTPDALIRRALTGDTSREASGRRARCAQGWQAETIRMGRRCRRFIV